MYLYIHFYMEHHKEIHNKLQSFYEQKRIPHLIFYGASGCGKQTIVMNFLKMIYKNEKGISSNVMFVNCAHGKGIKFIRDELKFFAKINVQLNTGITFKTIVLLNADHLTVDAQSAMRRCIEQYSNNTRFFIIIENKNKLLTPILSRFCEIYIPQRIDENNHFVNLHQETLQSMFPNYKHENKKRMAIIDELLEEYVKKRDLDHLKMTEISGKLYENACSCKDLIDWVQYNNFWNSLEKANVGMCFSKIKAEFRCEKLLMMYMLDFIFMDPGKDLKDISFI